MLLLEVHLTLRTAQPRLASPLCASAMCAGALQLNLPGVTLELQPLVK